MVFLDGVYFNWQPLCDLASPTKMMDVFSWVNGWVMVGCYLDGCEFAKCLAGNLTW